MKPSEAAKIIGCSTTQVRHLIRKGKIQATKKESPTFYGYTYHITQTEAERYRDKPQTGGGWPRGESYEWEEE